jgi:hypothetical protein
VAQPFLFTLSFEGALLFGSSSQRPLRLCALCVKLFSLLGFMLYFSSRFHARREKHENQIHRRAAILALHLFLSVH